MAEAPVLTDLVNLQNETSAVNAINANSAAISTAFEDVLSLSGTAPNQMQSQLDMNSNRVLNLPSPITADEPLRLQDAATLNGGGTIMNVPTGGTTGQVLAKTSGTDYDVSWQTKTGTVSSVGLAINDMTITNSPVTSTGTLTANWTTTPTGTGAVVKATSPTLVTPALGTPSALVLTNAVALPLSTGITGNLPNSNLATMNAFTLKGNATSSSAVPTDILMSSLTNKASPAGTDIVMISDQAASGALKYATVSSIGTSAGVSSIASNTGAFTLTGGITNSTNAIKRSYTEHVFQSTSLNPTGTVSTSGVMMGLGSSCTLTTATSTRILVTISGYLTSSVAAAGALTQIAYGTATAPSNGAAATGTLVGSQVAATSVSASAAVPFCVTAIITGLTAGTAYWFDLDLVSSSGSSTATAHNVTASIEEI